MIFVTVSTGHFDPLITACNRLSSKFSFYGQIGSSTVEPNFDYFRTGTPKEIEGHMNRAELVIAHAGTGMLSTLYRLQRPCVVVPKQRRYGEANDGQVELACQWARLGMAILCLDLNELEESIHRCRAKSFEFPVFSPLGKALQHLL